MPKVDKSSLAKTMEAIMLHLRLIRGVQGVQLAYVVREHNQVVYISHGYDSCLNHDKKMITRAPHCKWKVKTQDDTGWLRPNVCWLSLWYVQDWQSLMYHSFSNIFMNMNAYFKHKTEEEKQGWLSCGFWHPLQFLSPKHVDGKAAEAERKLQTSHYDGEKKQWYWEKHVAFHKEHHTIIKSHAGHGYTGINNGIKVCHFLQETRLKILVPFGTELFLTAFPNLVLSFIHVLSWLLVSKLHYQVHLLPLHMSLYLAHQCNGTHHLVQL